MKNDNGIMIFSGSSHPSLANEIAENLSTKLSALHIERFPDGETYVRILDSVRGQDVFIIQPIALDPNNNIMELLIIIDDLVRSSARSVSAVIPYLGYCRQDRREKVREPITAKLVANLITRAGCSRVITMDLHASQIQGFFDIPVDNLSAIPALATAVREISSSELIVVAPDLGSVKLARYYANYLGIDFAIIDKRRHSAHDVEVRNIIGDVNGKDVLLADDICSTGGTLVSAAKACQEKGAKRIFAAVTHALFVGDCVKKITESPIEIIFVSNTIPTEHILQGCSKVKNVSVASLFCHAISCISNRVSITTLHR